MHGDAALRRAYQSGGNRMTGNVVLENIGFKTHLDHGSIDGGQQGRKIGSSADK